MSPGKYASINQLVSTQISLVTQLKGWLMCKRYKAAIIFVDHFSWLGYLHFHKSLLSEETVQEKIVFKKFAALRCVKIKQDHEDNSRFADNAFIYHCETNHQHISYCSINAHFQNVIAKRAIRYLQDQA